MKIQMKGMITEAKLKADGIQVTIKDVHVQDLDALETLIELEKETNILISDSQTTLPEEEEV